jgi:glutaredoxin
MIQVFQAEWCPHSAKLRQRLTELGVDYVVRQVAPAPPERSALQEATGQDSIPAVILEDGTVVTGDTEDIIAEVEQQFPAHDWESDHRRQAIAHRSQTP